MSETEDTKLNRRDFVVDAATRAALGWLAVGSLRGLTSTRALAAPWGTGVQPPVPARDFNMVVVGDSLMWGQGLSEGNKFSSRVEQWLRGQLKGGRMVRRNVYAHSGATISPSGSSSTDIGDDKGFVDWNGEYPRSRMSVTYQVDWAKRDLPTKGIKVEDVDLVLMNGGINDVTITEILRLTNDANKVRQMTRGYVGGMRALLPQALCAFPNAIIVVTGYFPLASSLSQASALEGLFNANMVPTLSIIWEAVKPGIVERSAAFEEESRAVLREAVDHVNGVSSRASNLYMSDRQGGTGGGGNPSPPRGVPSATPSCGAKNRAVFVPIPWKPEYSYGVPGFSRLWRAGDEDDVRSDRVAFCDSRLGLLDPAHAKCDNASVGHPNHEGAALFASAIISALVPFIPEWNKVVGPTIASAPPPMLLASLDPLPTMGQASTVTIHAEDRSTRALVAGDVMVNGQVVAKTNTPFTYTFKCTLKAVRTTGGVVQRPTLCDDVVVSAHGYPDASVRIVEVEP
jgi:lysophospholipase L1-like esterase